jgi:hypothetical protein
MIHAGDRTVNRYKLSERCLSVPSRLPPVAISSSSWELGAYHGFHKTGFHVRLQATLLPYSWEAMGELVNGRAELPIHP